MAGRERVATGDTASVSDEIVRREFYPVLFSPLLFAPFIPIPFSINCLLIRCSHPVWWVFFVHTAAATASVANAWQSKKAKQKFN